MDKQDLNFPNFPEIIVSYYSISHTIAHLMSIALTLQNGQ